MQSLIVNNQAATMSSREIAELTGKRHGNVKSDIEKVISALGGDALKFQHTYYDSSNRAQTEYKLDRYHTEVLVTGYDVKRRAAVIKRWYDLETGSATPQVKDPQLAAMVTMLTQLDTVKQEQQAQRVEIEELRAKITATPDQFYAVSGYASLRGIPVDVRTAARIGRTATKISKDQELPVYKQHSELFGTVNTYHVDVLYEAFKAHDF